MRTFFAVLTAALALAVFASQASAQLCPPGPPLSCLGSGNPSDNYLLNTQRVVEKGGSGTSGIFDIAVPSSGTVLSPVKRVPRDKYGVVGPLPLTVNDLDALLYPGSSVSEKNAVLEGLTFFTSVHTPGESPLTDSHGVGPMNNQPFCQGCHENAAEAIRSRGLLGPTCPGGSICASVATRAGRSTPTNFEFTSLDLATGGGVAADNLDALKNTGKTAAFTTFGDFTSSLTDLPTPGFVGAIGFFDPLDGASHSLVGQPTGSFTSQSFGGQVQHVRPAVDACIPKPLPPVGFDTNLSGANPNDFNRSVGERAAPPYLGRGLMEAVPTTDITANTDPTAENGKSSLGDFATKLCMNNGGTGCISGKANTIPTTAKFVPGVGRFGLRANGVELLQFVVGGMQGELSLTNALNTAESNFPTLFPGGTTETKEPAACLSAASSTTSTPPTSPEVYLSTVFSIRALMRNTAPPEFGDVLLNVLKSPNPAKPQRWGSDEAKIQRGAQLFGIDLVAFANRTVGSGMTAMGDGRDLNAINQADRKLNCVGCHTPIQRTGQSPADVDVTDPDGGKALSFVWAPIFSDLLLHKMPVVKPELRLQTKPGLPTVPRDPLVIARLSTSGFPRVFNTFDMPRNLADNTFTNQKATADGTEFRTAPLMGLGRIGPPFLHDGRAYLSNETVNSTPAGTVTTNRWQTNAPLVVRSLDDALLAAIELHDLPAPDDWKTPWWLPGAGCPVPPKGKTNIDYDPSPKGDICPAYNSATSQANRSDSAEVIYRFRQLTPDDQQAVIEFLKQL